MTNSVLWNLIEGRVRPAEEILTLEKIQGLVEQTLAHGGQVGWKGNADGSRSA